MKGIILAGGLGTRLRPLTQVTNKHLLPIYDKPMVFYAIRTLVEGGIDDIALVVGGPFAGDFISVLGNGEDLGVKNLHYLYQRKEGGIAEALSLAEDFSDGEAITVILGDNIIGREEKFHFRQNTSVTNDRANIYLRPTSRWKDFGIAQIGETGIIKIVEKPDSYVGDKAVIGLYSYPYDVFDKIRALSYSARGELEITDLNNIYLNESRLDYHILDKNTFWMDCGSFENLTLCSYEMRNRKKLHG